MPLTGNFGYGAGAGHPDAMTGHGYSSLKGGPGNRMRPLQRGFPYDELDLTPEDDEEEEFNDDDELAVKVSQRNTVGSYYANDHMGMHARDRRSNVDSSSFGMSNAASFFENQQRLREISSGIRLRSRSAEPDAGTMYGWSSPPMWDKPSRFAGVKRPRLKDIIASDEEAEFEEDVERLSLDVQEEQILRHFILTTLHEVMS